RRRPAGDTGVCRRILGGVALEVRLGPELPHVPGVDDADRGPAAAMKRKNAHPELAGREVYYGGWGSYRIPFVPQDPLPEQEARARTSFYVGRYDAAGRLARFEKYL